MLEQVREKYPQYKDVPDDKLADGLYKKYYDGKITRDAFDKKAGVGDYKAKTGTVRTIAEQAYQGLTLGMGDEAIDAFAAAGATMATKGGYKDFKKHYKSARESSERDIKGQQEERPYLSFGSNVAGGILGSAAAITTKAGKEVVSRLGTGGLKSRIKKGAVVSGATGTAYGAATGFSPEERAEGGAVGGVLGLSLGGALPASGALTKKGVEVAKGGVEKVKGILSKDKTDKFSRVEKDIMKSYKDRPDLEGVAQKGRQSLKEAEESGVPITSAEALDDEALQRELGVLREEPEVGGAVQNFFQEREKAVQKALAAKQQGISPVQTVDEANEALVLAANDVRKSLAKARSKAAKPHYDEAYLVKDISSKEIDAVLKRDSGRKALAFARKRMSEGHGLMGVPEKELGAMARELASYGKMKYPKGGVSKGLKLRTLDYVKRQYDTMIGNEMKLGGVGQDNDYIGLLTEGKNTILREMDKVSPAYAKGRGIFATSIREQEEQLKGRFSQIMKLSDIGEEQATARLFAGTAGATEKTAKMLPKKERLSAASGQLLRVIEDNKQSSLTVPSKLGFGVDMNTGSITAAKQWESVLGDKYPKFVSLMNTINRANKGQKAAFGSPTQQKLSAAERIKKSAAEGAGDLAIGNRIGVIIKLRTIMGDLFNPRNKPAYIKERADILMSDKGVKLIEDLAETMKKKGARSEETLSAMGRVQKYLATSGAITSGDK